MAGRPRSFPPKCRDFRRWRARYRSSRSTFRGSTGYRTGRRRTCSIARPPPSGTAPSSCLTAFRLPASPAWSRAVWKQIDKVAKGVNYDKYLSLTFGKRACAGRDGFGGVRGYPENCGEVKENRSWSLLYRKCWWRKSQPTIFLFRSFSQKSLYVNYYKSVG